MIIFLGGWLGCWKIIRPLTVFGYDDAPVGHFELEFDNVYIPPQNLVGKLGSGFEIGQSRLGPGRLHHCMRAIGLAERAISETVHRIQSRFVFGRSMAQNERIQAEIAACRAKCFQARLVTLEAAAQCDAFGALSARSSLSLAKFGVSSCFSFLFFL